MINFNENLKNFINPYRNWIVIVALPTCTNITYSDIEFLKQNIHSFTKNNFSESQIYILTDNPNVSSTINDSMINIILNGNRLHIIKDFLETNKNVILLAYHILPKNSFFRFIIRNEHILSSFVKIDLTQQNIYSALGNKFGFDEIINDEIMVIPSNRTNYNFISKAIMMANQLHTTPDVSTKVALTILNNKHEFIKNIGELAIIENASPIQDKIETHNISESNINTDMIPYDNPSYIYYPYLDVDTAKEIIPSNSDYFNTNGYGPAILDKSRLFRRFDDKHEGIFIKKKRDNVIVPALLHHIWLDSDPDPIYQRAWAKILHQPWTYLVWTEKNINPSPKWKNLWEQTHDANLRYILAAMMILGDYGGFIVDRHSVPLKIIPEEVLMTKFIIGYENEASHGTQISYRIMAGAKNPPIVNKIFNVLGSNKTNKMEHIQNEITNDSDTIIYPSYYFNPSITTTPKNLLDRAISINLNKFGTDKILPKTPLQRNYVVTPDAIMAKLNENPRDNIIQN